MQQCFRMQRLSFSCLPQTDTLPAGQAGTVSNQLLSTLPSCLTQPPQFPARENLALARNNYAHQIQLRIKPIQAPDTVFHCCNLNPAIPRRDFCYAGPHNCWRLGCVFVLLCISGVLEHFNLCCVVGEKQTAATAAERQLSCRGRPGLQGALRNGGSSRGGGVHHMCQCWWRSCLSGGCQTKQHLTDTTISLPAACRYGNSSSLRNLQAPAAAATHNKSQGTREETGAKGVS